MHADAFFCIGRTHTVCQDYALCGKTPQGFPYAVVSDGCSSSPDTDFGARILAKVTARRLCSGEPLTDEFLIAEAAGVARQCSLPDTALDATLMYAHSMVGRAVQVVVYGDGAVISKDRAGNIAVRTIDYAHGAPGYLTYHLDSRRKEVYLEESDSGVKSIFRHNLGLAPRSDLMEGPPTTERGLRPYSIFFVPNEHEYVMLASDGLASFLRQVVTDTSSDQEAVDVLDLVRELTNFKGFKGQFIQRRCRKFFKFCAAEGWFNADDFSLAGIYLGFG